MASTLRTAAREAVNNLIERTHTRSVRDQDLQIIWRGYGDYMIVQEWGTGYLLMSSYSGYVSERLSTEQIETLMDFYKKNRRAR
jgi:hypothetical protein